jgi:hypothetical protein
MFLGRTVEYMHPLYSVYKTTLSGTGTETQREGMGLLEYQILPSLRDVAHDKWLLTLLYCITAAGNSISSQLCSSSQGMRYGSEKRQAVRTVHYVQNNTCRVTLLQPSRRAAVLGQPSSLQPHCSDPMAKLLQLLHLRTLPSDSEGVLRSKF